MNNAYTLHMYMLYTLSPTLSYMTIKLILTIILRMIYECHLFKLVLT